MTDLDKPVAIHAIGDMATEQAVRCLDHLKQDSGKLPPLIRLEHCQFISHDTAQKAKAVGIVLSMQPNFNYDSIQYSDRLPKSFCKKNNPFRMLVDQAGFIPGKDLILGSDGMPHGAEYALNQSLFPPFEVQELTLDEFIAGYCMADMKNGHIEIHIDNKKSNVVTKVILNQGK